MSRFDHLEIPVEKKTDLHEGAEKRRAFSAEDFIEKAESRFWDGDYEAALRYYSKALRENALLEDCWFSQVRCLLYLKEYKEALIWVDKALDKFPDSSNLLAAKAVVYSRLNQRQLSLDFSDAAISSKEQSVYPWIARGDVLMVVNVQNATRCLEKAVELAPSRWQTYMEIGDVLYHHEKYRNALTYFLKVVEMHSDNPRAWFMIGCCRYLLGFRKYQDALKIAEEIRPGWNPPWKFPGKKKSSLVKRLFRRFFSK